MGWCHTNPDPEEIDYVIPSNDDVWEPSNDTVADAFYIRNIGDLYELEKIVLSKVEVQPAIKVVVENSPKLTLRKK